VGTPIGELVSIILSILILISAGFFSKKTGLLKKEHNVVINNIIIYFAMPALIFRAVYKSDLSIELLIFPVVANIVMLANLGFAYIAAKSIRLPRPLFGAVILVSTIGNTGFLGYPLAIQLFGNDNFVKSVFYDLFGTVLFMFTIGILVAGRFGKAEERINVLKEVATFPPLIGMYAALALHGVKLPGFLNTAVDFMAGAAIPLIMISIGLALDVSEVKSYKRELAVAGTVKLLIAPLIALLFSLAFGLSRTNTGINVLEASTPAFLFSYIIGSRYGLDVDFIPAAVVVTTVVSMLTIPVWQYLLTKALV
jgi:auxin efflux carrier (AEC)